MFKSVLLASASVVALSGASLASDLPSKKAPPAAPSAQVASWTGCYAGLNGGFASQTTSTEYTYDGTTYDEGSSTGTGGAFGGQIGCDYQSGNVVFGVQGLIDWTRLSGSNEYTDNEGGVLTTDARWFATLTGRLGYTIQPETLLYVKGGAAWINNSYSDENAVATCGSGSGSPKSGSICDPSTIGKGSSTLTGWTAGAGVEHKFAANWSAFAEYDYMDFGSKSVVLTNANDDTWTNKYTNHVHVGIVGINYHF